MARPPIPARTSALKAKSVPAAALEILELSLRRRSRSSVATVTADWLRAACLTGLRPCEWSAAELEGAFLHVANAKTTNGRGNGPIRTLDLSALSETDLAVVRRMSENGSGWTLLGEYGDHQRRCAAALAAACRLAWPDGSRHYTLYSARHQSVANSRDTLSPVEVAALHGHRTARTARSHYGRRGSAWRHDDRPGTALPTAANVATVIPWTNPRFEPEPAPVEDFANCGHRFPR